MQFDEVWHDEKYDGTAHTMIGIVKDEDIAMIDRTKSFVETEEAYAHGIFTRDGFKFNSGNYSQVHNGGIALYKSGDTVRLILDLDAGALKFKWNYADDMRVFNISEDLPAYKYRLGASICHEESITIQ